MKFQVGLILVLFVSVSPLAATSDPLLGIEERGFRGDPDTILNPDQLDFLDAVDSIGSGTSSNANSDPAPDGKTLVFITSDPETDDRLLYLRDIERGRETLVKSVTQEKKYPSAFEQRTESKEEGLHFSPESIPLMERGRAAYRTGDWEEAVKIFREWLDRYQDGADFVRWYLAQSLFKLKRWDESAAVFQTLRDSRDVEKRASALVRLGMIDQQRGSLESARSKWKQVLEEYPDTRAAKYAAQNLETFRWRWLRWLRKKLALP